MNKIMHCSVCSELCAPTKTLKVLEHNIREADELYGTSYSQERDGIYLQSQELV